MNRRLELLSVGGLHCDPDLAHWLARQLRRRLGLPVRSAEPLPLHPAWRDADRGQYDSSRIVDALVSRDGRCPHPDGRWVLALTEVDLFADDRDFVFGEATLGGCWAVVSLARLLPGAEAAEAVGLLRRRVLKETVHELGHLAGLAHCSRSACVMSASRTVRDTDAKSASYCPACRAALAAPEGLDPPPPHR